MPNPPVPPSDLVGPLVGESYSTTQAGVTGRSLVNGGVGIYGTGGLFAGKFDGDVEVNGSAWFEGTLTATGKSPGQVTPAGLAIDCASDAHIAGTLTVDKDVVLSGADCAEEFDLQGAGEAEPGTVMVLDEMGSLEPGRQVYDKKGGGSGGGGGLR